MYQDHPGLRMFYGSPAAEAAAIRRAAARAGCAVRSLRIDGVGGELGAQVVGALVCADGWAAARLLLALSEEDAATVGAQGIARELRQRSRGDEAFAHAIVRFVQDRVRFVREEGERFASGALTLRAGLGDCDDHFRLVYALARAGGLPARLALTHHGDDAPPEKQGPTHAAAQLLVRGRWEWAETTVRAFLGEHPYEAARRLGLLSERADVAREVRIMSAEKDLGPIPFGFVGRNDPARVALDAEALRRLGYLAPDACVELGDATDPTFRRAVLAFQSARNLSRDGLIGPLTRAELLRALQEAGPPVTEGFGYPGIGELAPASVPAGKLSARLSSAFLAAVVDMAERFRELGAKVTAEDFLLVWLAESGIDSHRANGLGAPFGGLNQMGPQERKAVGFFGTFADWLALDELAQLPFVERYYVNAIKGGAGGNFGVLTTAQSLYLANAAPAFLAHADDPDHVVFRRDPNGPQPNASAGEWDAWRAGHKSDPYAWNLGLDANKDGTIRVGELGAVLSAAARARGAFWEELRGRVQVAEIADGRATPASGVPTIVGLLALGAMAVATYYAVRS